MSLMRKFVLACLIVLAFGAARGAVAQQSRGADVRTVKQLPSREKRWALLVGVSNYEDGNITDLNGARDAKALQDALVQYAGFPENQIILLTTDQPRERQPTRENIIRRLANLKGLIPNDGLFLFAFSGHGIESKEQAFLIPSTMSYDDDIEVLKETAVSVEFIRRQIKLMNVQQVLVLLDACRNDPSSSRSDSTNLLTPAYTKGFNFDVRNREVTAYATLYATSVGARAYEYSEKAKGYFTWAVVEALKGAAANEHGEVTLYALVKYVEDVVPLEVRKDLGTRKKQQPFAVIEGYKADELVLAINSTPARDEAQTGVRREHQRDKDWTLVDKRDKTEIQLFLSKYKADLEATLSLRRLEAQEPKAGDVMTANLPNGVEMKFIYVPPGNFKMGGGRFTDELPSHPVSINNGFWLGQTEVTQGQWHALKGTYPSWFRRRLNRLGNDTDLPVESVSWLGVQEFIKYLNSQQNNYIYRLPTEAEWEYAARAGAADTSTRDLRATGWCYANAGQKLLASSEDYEIADKNGNQPHPVAHKLPNAWGFYDMVGNVSEWVSTKHKPYPYSSADGRESSIDDSSARVARGGNYLSPDEFCTVTNRSDGNVDESISNIGFRLVLMPKR